jgi:hypothetical protein
MGARFTLPRQSKESSALEGSIGGRAPIRDVRGDRAESGKTAPEFSTDQEEAGKCLHGNRSN